MTDPLSFVSTTPRHALPLLFSGQAQKEIFVNEAHARADLLLHPAVKGEVAAPPANPLDGESWLVADGAQGDFAGHDGAIAGRQAGVWIFTRPRDGMRVLDQATGQHVLFAKGWQREPAPAAPSGGTTVDSEARAAIESVVIALQRTGIFPSE